MELLLTLRVARVAAPESNVKANGVHVPGEASDTCESTPFTENANCGGSNRCVYIRRLFRLQQTFAKDVAKV